MAGLAAAAPAGANGGAGDRAQALARMRLLATGLLAAMAAIFVGASLGGARWPALAYLRAFAEAGVVGACADWFAVTALFRRPLGLPIPHTAVIPRNKARIGQALGAFIADNFLTREVLDEKLRQLEVGRWGGAWLSRRENAARLARRIAAAAPRALAALPKEALRDLVGAAARAAVRATPASPLAGGLLSAFWSDGAGQAALEDALAALARLLAEHRAALRQNLAERTHTWLPGWIDRLLAGQVIDGLVKVLTEMRDPAHPWRAQLGAWVTEWTDRLAHDPELAARGERIKTRLLDDPRVALHAGQIWDQIEARLAGLAAADNPELTEKLEGAIQALGRWLRDDAAAQERLNTWSRLFLRGVVAPRRHAIGLAVAQVVAGWDSRSVTDKLELQVGRDLQYIRINGTVVGGLVGLAMFAAARALGLG